MLSLRKSRFAMTVKHWALLGDSWLAPARRFIGTRRAVLFEVFNPPGFDAQEPVIHSLVERGLVDVHVSGGLERGIAPSRVAALARARVRVHKLQASRHRRFDAVVVTDGRLVNSWRSSRYVFLHHGSASGNLPVPYALQLLESGAVNYLLAIHPAEARVIASHLGPRMQGRVRVVGQPKLDRLVNSSYSSQELLESLGLDPMRRTVLYLSHWTPTSLMHTCGEEILGLLRVRTEFNVLVTGHLHLWDHPARSGGVDWRARLGWIADEPHMRLLPQAADLHEIMAAADLAITDHTSATLEYALLYRPIVLFRNPDAVFSDAGLDARLRRTAIVFSDVREFPAAFEQAVRMESIDGAPRRALLDSCFRHLGESSLQAAIAIEEIALSGALSDVPPTEDSFQGQAVSGKR